VRTDRQTDSTCSILEVVLYRCLDSSLSVLEYPQCSGPWSACHTVCPVCVVKTLQLNSLTMQALKSCQPSALTQTNKPHNMETEELLRVVSSLRPV
jgi:hypothetical protein